MLTVLIPPHRGTTRLQRCLFGLISHKPRQAIDLWLCGPERASADVARQFGAMVSWHWLRTADAGFNYTTALEHVKAEKLMVLDPCVIPTPSVLDMSEPACTGCFLRSASIYALWSLLEEKVDDYGANIHAGMIRHCCDNFPVSTPLVHGRLDLCSFGSRSALTWLDGQQGSAVHIERTTSLAFIQGETPTWQSGQMKVLEVINSQKG